VLLERLREWLDLEVATGDAGDSGLYEESEAFSDGPEELATLPLPPNAAGGRLKLVSN
jgi:hypothetical protein